MSATALSARNGILVRNREAFERARALSIVAFDKTGTLTEGRFGVREVYSDGLPKEHTLRLAAGLETRSEHPLARAIVEAAQNSGLTPDVVEEFSVLAGRGVEGRLAAGPTVSGARNGRSSWTCPSRLL